MTPCARLCMALFCASLILGCKVEEPPGTPDAGDPPMGDAGTAVDATPVDAGPCPGGMLFTGGYEDWDSTPEMFDGIDFATLTQADDAGNTTMTAPNGRSTMCLPDRQVAVEFTHPQYLDLRYTASPDAVNAGSYDVVGLTPARIDELFTTEFGLVRDIQTAQALIAVRIYPGGQPAVGATVALGNGNGGAYVDSGNGVYGAGDTLANGPFVYFANVDIAGGTTSVQVTPPAGATCSGAPTIELVADSIAATTIACVRQ